MNVLKSKLLRKFMSFSYGSWLGMLIGFLGTIITTRLLDPEDFGKASMFTLAMQLIMIFMMFGTDQAFVRFFYEEKEESRSRLLFHSLKLPMLIALFILPPLIIFYQPVTRFLIEEELFHIAALLVIGILFQFFYRFAALVIRMKQKGHLYSILEIANRTLNVVFIILFVFWLGASFKTIIYATVVTFIVLSVIAILFEKSFWRFNRVNSRTIESSNQFKEIAIFSYPLVISTMITWLFQSFDRIALKQYSTFEELGLFAAALKIIALLSVIQVAFSTFWAPICYEHYEKNPHDTDFYARIARIVAIIMFSISIGMIAGKELIIMFLGSAYREAAFIMPFLLFMPMLYTMSLTTGLAMNLLKKTKWHIPIAILACIVNIVGNIGLVPSYGAIGAALSTAIAYIIYFAIRTHVSQYYLPIRFGLVKMYTMMGLIFCSAGVAVIYRNNWLDVAVGAVLLILMGIFYRRDLLSIFSKRALSN
jgi:O-antigen/teichoic acid export membrane protein